MVAPRRPGWWHEVVRAGREGGAETRFAAGRSGVLRRRAGRRRGEAPGPRKERDPEGPRTEFVGRG